MSEGRSGQVRVRIAGQELQLPDLDAVRRLVEEGQIGSSAEVRLPGAEGWMPLAQALAAPPRRKDLWSVWEEAETAEPMELPRAPVRVEPPRKPADELQDLPLGALTPVEEERREGERAGPKFVIDASKRSAGKVIAFPVGRTQAQRPVTQPDHETTGPLALAPSEPVPLRPPPPPPRAIQVVEAPPRAEPPPVRWGRVGALLALGVAALLLARWYVVGQATEGFPPTPSAPPVAAELPQTASPPPTPEAPPSAPPASPADAVAGGEPYADLEQELRALLLPDVREATSEEAIEDAFLIELHAVRLNIVRVDASVSGWAGRKRDQPKVLTLRIDLRSEPSQIDWDLGAVGLVVGKYVQRFGYELTRLEVVFEGVAETPQKMPLDPEASRQLYLERLSLLEYLQARPKH